MAIKFLSSENIAGDIDVTLSKNGITYLAVTNTNNGVSANARVQVVGETSQLDLVATSAGYTGVSGWADSGIISTDSGASGGLKLNSQAGGIQLQSGTTSYVTMSASGTVGIGTDSPTARLDVLTNSVTGDNNIDRHVRFRADNGEQRFNFFVGRSGNSANLSIYNSSEGVGAFISSDADSYFIGGNVGIGVSSIQPWARLEVAGTAGAQTAAKQALYVSSPSTTAGEGVGMRMSAASGTHEAVGIIGVVNNASGNAGSMTFHTYNLGSNIPERMRIDSDGNVGIGTASPDARLHIYGSSSLSEMYLGEDAAADKAGILKYTQGDGSGTGVITLSHWGNTSTTQSLAIKYGGNVGIGTTSPATSYGFSKTLEIQGAANAEINISQSDNSKDWSLGIVNGANYQQTTSGQDYIWLIGGSEKMRITSGGNVGIGATSPAGKLEVAGGSTLGLRLSNVGDQSAYDQVRMTYSGYNSGAPTVTFMPLTTPGSGNVDTTFHFSNTNGIGANNNRANVNIDGVVDIGSGRQSGETTLVMRNYDASLVDSNEIQNSIRMSGRYWSGSASQLVETRINSVHQESNGNGGSALTFWTQTGGDAPNEKLRIDKSGRVIVYQKENVSGFYLDGGNTRLYANGGGGTDYRGIECNSSGMWSWGETGTNNYFAKPVGIGTTSPGTYKLNVVGTALFSGGVEMAGGGAVYQGSKFYLDGGGDTFLESPSSNIMTFTTNAVEKMRIDSSGQITNTMSGGKVLTDTNGFITSFQTLDTATAGGRYMGKSNRGLLGQMRIEQTATGADGGYISFDTCASGSTSAITRMQITSGGDFLIGGQAIQAINSVTFDKGSNGFTITNNTTSGAGNGYEYQVFRRNSSQIGSIIMSGTSGVQYLTSSDYRLKENVVEMTGALDRVSQLKPSRFNFIADADKTVDGFLAHEVQEIVPEAISGEKDAMQDEEYEVSPAVYEDVLHPAIEEELDENGNVITEAKEEWTENILKTEAVKDTRQVPYYQGIDQSKLVPLLVGAIQELKAEIDLLKGKCKCK